MKSTIAIGVIALLPFLALFTLCYFGIHKLHELFKIANHSEKISPDSQAQQTISI